MECPGCRHPNAPDAAFCDECGARLEATCAACGESNRLGARFCKKCGAPISGGATPRARPDTPRHLAEKILTSRGAIEGERKQVTVLFADIKGSMELLEGRDPEEARTLLDPALYAMMDAVHRYEGTVNQVLGDGLMVLFGAPLAHEDHAIRACYAALAIRQAIGRYTETVRRSHGVEIQARIGLNSGEVVVRAIGSDLRMDYSAVGQTTHLAARMEQLANPGTIRLTGETLRLVEGLVQVRPLGPVPVKGLPAPVEVFELVGATAVRTRLQAAAGRGFTRFVGRQAELGTLAQALARARDGHGQVVALVGEPGVGKSRLFWEFAHSHRTQGCLVLESGSVSYGKATAYLPLVELLKGYFHIEERDDARAIREKVTGKLLALDEALRATVAPLLALLDVPVEDREWLALEPSQRRLRTLDAARRLLLRESRVQPLIVILEDLHWIDSETQAFLDSLVESLPAARVLLLVNYRPEYRHAWAGKSSYSQLRIDPLPPQAAEELLETILGSDGGLGPLKRLLVERTEGNPFFLEESVRTLAETGALAGERGAYRLARQLAAIQVPATVQAVLAARIDRLPAEEKRLLQSAAVIGKDVPLPLLEAITDLDVDTLPPALAHLRAAEFLYEAGLFPEIEYTFKHAVTHEVAYGSLLAERRKALHARIVDAIERLHPDRRAEQIERLAHHAHRGELWERAVTYLSLAGATAFQRSANREAAAYFEQALAALGHMPEGRETVEAAIDLRFDLRNALFPIGEHARLGEHLREAQALAEALGDQARLGRAHAYLTNYFLSVGDHERAVASGERALAIAEALDDVDLRTGTLFHLGQLYASLGDYRRAADLMRRNVEAIGAGPTEQPLTGSALLTLSRTWLTWCLAEVGDFAEAVARGEARLHAAESAGEPFELVSASLGIGLVHLRRGDVDTAARALEQALPLCRTGNLSVWFPAVASPLGYAYALAGRLAEGIALLEAAVEETTTRRGAGHALRLAHLGEAYLIADSLEEAGDLAERALGLSRERKERGHEAYALRLVAAVAARRDPPELEYSNGRYRQAIALADELGMRPLVARCRLELSALCRRLGQAAEGRAALTAAIDAFRAMQMRRWLDGAEQTLTEG